MERLPGFRDFFPDPIPQADTWSAGTRQYIFDRWRAVAGRYGFREYDGPPLEPLELYTAKSGEEIVGQLYSFQDKGRREVALRAEMTPTLARMAVAHSRSYRKPMKWFAIPQLFRYERQQKGRLREHFQFNADILGEPDLAADAELIALLIDSLRVFGLTADDFVIRLSSRNAWDDFLQPHRPDAARAAEFYQVVDKLERETTDVSRQKFNALGIPYEQVLSFIHEGGPTAELENVLANLAARGLGPYVRIDYHVIRGLAYYTGVVFEAFDKTGAFRALAGGGRYDNLVGLLSAGKVEMPAAGFGFGDVVLTELLKQRKLLPETGAAAHVFCLAEDDASLDELLKTVQFFRDAGLATEYSLARSKSDKQFKKAVESGARFICRVEAGGTGGPAFRVRDGATREERRLESAALALAHLKSSVAAR